MQPQYDDLGNRVAQTIDGETTNYALDIAGGLPEMVQTSEGNSYLHLPCLIMTENEDRERRYLLQDGLGSVRLTLKESGSSFVTYATYQYSPNGEPDINFTQYSAVVPPGYPHPVFPEHDTQFYGYTGEWWEADLGLLSICEQDGIIPILAHS